LCSTKTQIFCHPKRLQKIGRAQDFEFFAAKRQESLPDIRLRSARIAFARAREGENFSATPYFRPRNRRILFRPKWPE
jgi:hypothetical protein